MAEFHEIGSSQFHEKATLTGSEKIQVSATEYVTLQAIANLYKEKGGFSEVVIANSSLVSGTSIKDTFWNLNTVANIQALVNKANAGELVPIALKINQGMGSNNVKTITGYMMRVVATSPAFTYRITALGSPGTDSEQSEVINITLGSTTGTVSNAWDVYLYKAPISPSMVLKGFAAGTIEDKNSLIISAVDTVLSAFKKLSNATGDGKIIVLGTNIGFGGIYLDTDYDLFSGFLFSVEEFGFYKVFERLIEDIEGKTNQELSEWMIAEGDFIPIPSQNSYQTPIKYQTQNTNFNAFGGYAYWYTGTVNPTITLHILWDGQQSTSSIVMPYNRTPTFMKSNSSDVIHLHQQLSEVAPTSGYKVYTIFCQVVGIVRHFFINVAPYN